MKKLLSKIRNLRKTSSQEAMLAKIAILEEQVSNLEQANVIILTKLLQIGNLTSTRNKIDDKTEILAVTQKGVNAGKTPTFH